MENVEEHNNPIKIKVDAPEPSSEEIAKFKSYPKLMKTYHDMHTHKGLYKMWYYDKRKLSMIVVIFVILLLIVLGEIDISSFIKSWWK